MKVFALLSVGACALAGLCGVAVFAQGYPLSIVRHRWQEIITESNHAALRPGSVYDILTHFEQNSGRTRPQFKYLFFDTGLGAADSTGKVAPITAKLGTLNATATATAGTDGMYQIQITIPAGASGAMPLSVTQNAVTSNEITVNVK